MSNDSGLISAYLFDGAGRGEPLDFEGVRDWHPDSGLLWVHFDYSAPATEAWIRNEARLDEIICEAMLESETRPRTLVHKDGLFVTLRGVNLHPQSDPEDMVSVRVWIDEKRIISTRRRRLLSIDGLRSALENGHGPKTQGEFLVDLADRLVERIANVIDDIDDGVDDLQDQVLTMESHQLRPLISHLRRQAIGLRRYLGPQREALSKLYNDRAPWLTDLDRMHLREVSDHMIRCIEELDASRERAAVTQEELVSRLSENIEKRMYVISLVSVIFLPLSFLTGLLGINVGGIPGAENPIAFMVVCFLMLIIAGFQFWLFKKLKWV